MFVWLHKNITYFHVLILYLVTLLNSVLTCFLFVCSEGEGGWWVDCGGFLGIFYVDNIHKWSQFYLSFSTLSSILPVFSIAIARTYSTLLNKRKYSKYQCSVPNLWGKVSQFLWILFITLRTFSSFAKNYYHEMSTSFLNQLTWS